jgi:hypothetical protein
MNTLKKLADVGVFILALTSAIAFTRFLTRLPAPAQPPQPAVNVVVTEPPATAPAAETPVSFSARLVTLDLGRLKSHTTLQLERDRRYPAPESVWVWTYFFTPAFEGKMAYSFHWAGEPVEIRRPFADGDKVTVSAEAACSWCNDKAAPVSGYYARVNISTQSSAAARLSAPQLSYEMTSATPVVVEAAAKKSR